MKTLLNLALAHNSRVVLIKFSHKNIIKIGYAIIDKKDNELMSFEPCNYSNGDKWIVRNNCASKVTGVPFISYMKNLREAKALRHDIREGFTGMVFNPSPKFE